MKFDKHKRLSEEKTNRHALRTTTKKAKKKKKNVRKEKQQLSSFANLKLRKMLRLLSGYRKYDLERCPLLCSAWSAPYKVCVQFCI